MVSGAPQVGGHGDLDLVDVLAAAGPGGLDPYGSALDMDVQPESHHRRACHDCLAEIDQRRPSVAARRPFCPCGQATTKIAVTVETAVLVPHGHRRR